jgi:hypothetical protein
MTRPERIALRRALYKAAKEARKHKRAEEIHQRMKIEVVRQLKAEIRGKA